MHVVVCVHVAVGGEEEEPGSIVVHEVGGFDDAFVRGAFVVEDCGGGAEEGCAGGGEALDAEGGGDYGCDCDAMLGCEDFGIRFLEDGLPLTSVTASSAVADGVAVDFPGDPALAIVVVYRGIDGATLSKWADQSLVADWFVGSGDAAGFCGADAVLCCVLLCGGAVVHHEAAVV